MQGPCLVAAGRRNEAMKLTRMSEWWGGDGGVAADCLTSIVQSHHWVPRVVSMTSDSVSCRNWTAAVVAPADTQITTPVIGVITLGSTAWNFSPAPGKQSVASGARSQSLAGRSAIPGAIDDQTPDTNGHSLLIHIVCRWSVAGSASVVADQRAVACSRISLLSLCKHSVKHCWEIAGDRARDPFIWRLQTLLAFLIHTRTFLWTFTPVTFPVLFCFLS